MRRRRRMRWLTWSRVAVVVLGLWSGAGAVAIGIDVAESLEWRGPPAAVAEGTPP